MTALLEARDVAYLHPDGFRLEGISLRLEAGERVALVGPNGAGKSTLLKILAGVLRPTGGTLTLEGEPSSGVPPRRWAQKTAWVPQEMDAPPSLTVEELVGLGFFPRSTAGGWVPAAGAREALEKILRTLALEPLRRRPVGLLSGGERRRALLGRGLAQGAKILLLDEPTAHLDPRHQVELLDVLDRLRREAGVAVVMALHDVNLAMEACGRVLLLAGGRLVASGPPAETLTSDVLARAYGVRARVTPGAGGGPGHVRFSIQPQEESS